MPDFSRLRPHSSQGWLAWVLLAFILFFSVTSDQFLTVQNLLDLAESYAVTGIFALGLFVVLVTGGIDISFAAGHPHQQAEQQRLHADSDDDGDHPQRGDQQRIDHAKQRAAHDRQHNAEQRVIKLKLHKQGRKQVLHH